MAGTNPAVVAVFARALTTFSHNKRRSASAKLQPNTLRGVKHMRAFRARCSIMHNRYVNFTHPHCWARSQSHTARGVSDTVARLISSLVSCLVRSHASPSLRGLAFTSRESTSVSSTLHDKPTFPACTLWLACEQFLAYGGALTNQ